MLGTYKANVGGGLVQIGAWAVALGILQLVSQINIVVLDSLTGFAKFNACPFVRANALHLAISIASASRRARATFIASICADVDEEIFLIGRPHFIAAFGTNEWAQIISAAFLVDNIARTFVDAKRTARR